MMQTHPHMRTNLLAFILLGLIASCTAKTTTDESNDEQRLELSNNQQQQLIDALASELHETWRGNRLLPDGTYDPRPKKTKDQTWIDTHGTDTVDIANTSFTNLPADWQEENMKASIVAMGAVIAAYHMGKDLNDAFVEKASEQVHIAWLERNKDWAQEDQKVPYAELSEDEKDKDRVQVTKGIEVLHHYLQGLNAVSQ